MKLRISKEKTLKEIQHEFQVQFPYLKLAFYPVRDNPTDGMENGQIDSSLTLEQMGLPLSTYELILDGQQKICDFEQIFLKNSKLYVRVLRKSKDKWLQSWATNIWTLEEQNNRGRFLAKLFS